MWWSLLILLLVPAWSVRMIPHILVLVLLLLLLLHCVISLQPRRNVCTMRNEARLVISLVVVFWSCCQGSYTGLRLRSLMITLVQALPVETRNLSRCSPSLLIIQGGLAECTREMITSLALALAMRTIISVVYCSNGFTAQGSTEC